MYGEVADRILIPSLYQQILFGDEQYMEQQDAIIVWLSDSPQLNEQSKQKIDSKADKIKLSQCVTVSEESFDKEVFEDGHVYFLNTQKLSVMYKTAIREKVSCAINTDELDHIFDTDGVIE